MDSSQKSELNSPTPIRLYEIWPGKNQFFLKGHLMLGPAEESKKSLTILFTLVVLESFFILFICPYLWFNVSKLIPILSCQLFLTSIFFMIRTMTTDPGIIPRKEIFESFGQLPEIFANQGEDNKKYCKTCKLFKPARSSHCKKCDNCVELFDHHCNLINNCIGKNNYKWFAAMVAALTLLGGMNISGLILFFFCSGRDRTRRSCKGYLVVANDTFLISVAVALTLTIILLTSFVFLLCLFHIKLSLSGETTKEYKLNSNASIVGNWIHAKYWFHPRLIINSVKA